MSKRAPPQRKSDEKEVPVPVAARMASLGMLVDHSSVDEDEENLRRPTSKTSLQKTYRPPPPPPPPQALPIFSPLPPTSPSSLRRRSGVGRAPSVEIEKSSNPTSFFGSILKVGSADQEKRKGAKGNAARSSSPLYASITTQQSPQQYQKKRPPKDGKIRRKLKWRSVPRKERTKKVKPPDPALETLMEDPSVGGSHGGSDSIAASTGARSISTRSFHTFSSVETLQQSNRTPAKMLEYDYNYEDRSVRTEDLINDNHASSNYGGRYNRFPLSDKPGWNKYQNIDMHAGKELPNALSSNHRLDIMTKTVLNQVDEMINDDSDSSTEKSSHHQQTRFSNAPHSSGWDGRFFPFEHTKSASDSENENLAETTSVQVAFEKELESQKKGLNRALESFPDLFADLRQDQNNHKFVAPVLVTPESLPDGRPSPYNAHSLTSTNDSVTNTTSPSQSTLERSDILRQGSSPPAHSKRYHLDGTAKSDASSQDPTKSRETTLSAKSSPATFSAWLSPHIFKESLGISKTKDNKGGNTRTTRLMSAQSQSSASSSSDFTPVPSAPPPASNLSSPALDDEVNDELGDDGSEAKTPNTADLSAWITGNEPGTEQTRQRRPKLGLADADKTNDVPSLASHEDTEPDRGVAFFLYESTPSDQSRFSPSLSQRKGQTAAFMNQQQLHNPARRLTYDLSDEEGDVMTTPDSRVTNGSMDRRVIYDADAASPSIDLSMDSLPGHKLTYAPMELDGFKKSSAKNLMATGQITAKQTMPQGERTDRPQSIQQGGFNPVGQKVFVSPVDSPEAGTEAQGKGKGDQRQVEQDENNKALSLSAYAALSTIVFDPIAYRAARQSSRNMPPNKKSSKNSIPTKTTRSTIGDDGDDDIDVIDEVDVEDHGSRIIEEETNPNKSALRSLKKLRQIAKSLNSDDDEQEAARQGNGPELDISMITATSSSPVNPPTSTQAELNINVQETHPQIVHIGNEVSPLMSSPISNALASDPEPGEAKKKQLRKISAPVDVDENRFIDAERHLRAIHEMAAEHLEHGEYEEALEVFEEILRGQRERHGENHHRVGTALHNIGIVLLRMREYERAVDVCGHAVEVRKTALGHDHPDLAVSLAQLGIANLECNEYRYALLSFREALRIRRHHLGSNHPKVAKILNNIGCTLFELDELKGALLAFEEALSIQRKMMKTPPQEGHEGRTSTDQILLSIAATQCNIGSIKLRWGEFEESIVSLEDALLIQQSVLGDEHPTVLNTIESIDFVDALKTRGEEESFLEQKAALNSMSLRECSSAEAQENNECNNGSGLLKMINIGGFGFGHKKWYQKMDEICLPENGQESLGVMDGLQSSELQSIKSGEGDLRWI